MGTQEYANKDVYISNTPNPFSKAHIGGNEITIEGFEKEASTGDFSTTFSFVNIEQEKVTVTVPRNDLNPNSLRKIMLKKGGENVDSKGMWRYFEEQECEFTKKEHEKLCPLLERNKWDLDGNPILEESSKVPFVSNTHKTVGWNNEELMCFYGENKISAKGEETSRYIGNLQISQQGTFKMYIKGLEDNVYGNVPLEAILSMAASATVLRFANEHWKECITCPIIHIHGGSTTGKSTAAMLYASMGGNPEQGKPGEVFLSFNGTLNALLKKLKGNYGYPMAIDEMSHVRDRYVSEFLYAVAEGKGKERLTRGGANLQESDGFSTTFLTNGEGSILAKCNTNEGLRVRVLEIEGIKWTPSAMVADAIKAFVKENHGFVTPLVAKKVLEDKDAKWHNKMNEWWKRFKLKATDNHVNTSLTDRIAKTLALFMVSAEILNDILGNQLCIAEIFDFFYREIIEKNAEHANVGTRAYECIIEDYSRNIDKYEDCSYNICNYLSFTNPKKGVLLRLKYEETIEGIVYDRALFILEKDAEELLSKGGFSSCKVCMRAIKELGLLRTKDKNRLYYEHVINDVSCKGYKILVQKVECVIDMKDDDE